MFPFSTHPGSDCVTSSASCGMKKRPKPFLNRKMPNAFFWSRITLELQPHCVFGLPCLLVAKEPPKHCSQCALWPTKNLLFPIIEGLEISFLGMLFFRRRPHQEGLALLIEKLFSTIYPPQNIKPANKHWSKLLLPLGPHFSQKKIGGIFAGFGAVIANA